MQRPPEPPEPLDARDPDASLLERSLGPSCLLSLVITLLLVLALERVIRVGPVGMAVVAFVVWALVVVLLVRWRAAPARRELEE